MAAHTLGPFMKFAADVDCSTQKGLVAVFRSPTGKDISVVSTSDVASYEVEANAALLVAAPNMLAVLQKALDDWPDWEDGEPVNGGDMVEWFGNWRGLAKEAVKKAEE